MIFEVVKMKADITYRAVNSNGEVNDYGAVMYNFMDLTSDQFRTFVENNAQAFAEECCYYDESDEFDFVAVTRIDFDAEEC